VASSVGADRASLPGSPRRSADSPNSDEALAALEQAIAEAGELRIEVRPTTGDDA